MSRHILDENGNSIFGEAKQRLEEIKKEIEPYLADIKARTERNEQKMYPAKLNFLPTVTNLLDPRLRKRPLVRFDYAVQISAEELQEYSDAFFDLLIFIRNYVPDYIANKQVFCAFASIPVSAFNKLQNAESGEIGAIIENLIDSFQDTNMSGAMGGAVNTAATFNRMRAKEAGYSMAMTQTGEESQASNNILILSNEDVKRKLSSMIENAKKE